MPVWALAVLAGLLGIAAHRSLPKSVLLRYPVDTEAPFAIIYALRTMTEFGYIRRFWDHAMKKPLRSPCLKGLFSFSKYWRGVTFFCFFLSCSLRAENSASVVTLDFPVPANQATPAWLGHPITPPTSFATLDLPILTPDTSSSLLVTVYFQEKEGGFMRITWNGIQGAQLLSANFYEGIGMANQRSLLLPAETIAGDGTLTFQCGESTLGIQRIKLQLLQTKGGLVSPDVQDLLVTAADGSTLPAPSLNGQPPQADPAAWLNEFVKIPLADQPVRIEQGVEFSVDLDKVPASARLVLKEAGLPLDHHLEVWINQQRAGTITPFVPDLADDGFLGTATDYVGWRDGSFYAPVNLLKTGPNTIQFEPENDTTPAGEGIPANIAPPLALKEIYLQLSYPPPPETTAAPDAPSALMPPPVLSPLPPSEGPAP